MKYLRTLLISIALFVYLPLLSNERRVALVIGNANYSEASGFGKLKAPLADAKAMASQLEALGFEISGGKALLDADRETIVASVKQFSQDCQGADVALFYYSGHGAVYRNRDNLLIPVGEEFTPATIKANSYELQNIEDLFEDLDCKAKIIILDACRNNPYRNAFGKDGSGDVNGGLVRNPPAKGTVIYYATRKDKVALPEVGDSKYSIFTEAWLDALKNKPYEDLNKIFIHVKEYVYKKTRNAQMPEQGGTIEGVLLAHPVMVQNSSESHPMETELERLRQENEVLKKQQQEILISTISRTDSLVTLYGVHNGHEWVDLGLPSGLLWATCNVGSSIPTDIGDHYAWGEISPKSSYSWTNYKWYNRSEKALIKYSHIDNKTSLDLSDDAASQNWGGNWRMPSEKEYKELTNNCIEEWVLVNDRKVLKLTSRINGLSIYLPSSKEFRPTLTYWFSDIAYSERYMGKLIRPVLSLEASKEMNSITASETDMDSSLPYLTFTSNGYTTISLKKINNPKQVKLEYKKEKEPWKQYQAGKEINLKHGEKVSFRAAKCGNTSMGYRETYNNYHYHQFSFSGPGTIAASGSIMSLLDQTCKLRTIEKEYCFWNLFCDAKSLTSAPSLDATSLSYGCYEYMFSGCTSLKKAPELPALEMKECCYFFMFSKCTNLIEAPKILPAKRLARFCYARMFSNCISLERAPELPADSLVKDCYGHMFYGCTNLKYIKMLVDTQYTFYDNTFYHCLENWVEGVAPTGTFVKKKGSPWNVRGIHGIPKGWEIVTE